MAQVTGSSQADKGRKEERDEKVPQYTGKQNCNNSECSGPSSVRASNDVICQTPRHNTQHTVEDHIIAQHCITSSAICHVTLSRATCVRAKQYS